MKASLDIPFSDEEITRLFGVCKENLFLKGFFNTVVLDSRLCTPNSIFIAIKGEKVNGADFINEAKEKGALVIAECPEADFCVKSSVSALLMLANAYKEKLICLRHTIAITGSVGKTTTKEFLAQILSEEYKVHATNGNYNSEIGVALTLLSAKRDTEILILECGMNHFGELSSISYAILPDIAIITNIGTAHIGNFGSRENIAKAKLEILDCGKVKQTFIPYKEDLLSIKDGIKISANDPYANCYFDNIKRTLSGYSFTFHSENNSCNIPMCSIFGKQNLTCLAFAISVADTITNNNLTLINGVAKITNEMTRQRIIDFENFKILDDSYNSSLESVLADFELMRDFDEPKSALLADIYELGEKSEEIHRIIGKAAAKENFSHLFLFGKYSHTLKEAAIVAGMEPGRIFVNDMLEAPEITAQQIKCNAIKDEIILAKGSRKTRIERIYKALGEKDDG